MEKTIRLTPSQLEIIVTLFDKHFLKQDELWLFGSRVNPSKKGGDIDLFVETWSDDLSFIAQKKISFLVDLKKNLGDQKIDLIVHSLTYPTQPALYQEIKETGVQIK